MTWNTSNPHQPTIQKKDVDYLDYPISFVAWLANEADSYASHTCVFSEGLSNTSHDESGGVIIVFLGGGDVGDVEQFTIQLTTQIGRIINRTFYVEITS